jgi:hypothetical protein
MRMAPVVIMVTLALGSVAIGNSRCIWGSLHRRSLDGLPRGRRAAMIEGERWGRSR